MKISKKLVKPIIILCIFIIFIYIILRYNKSFIFLRHERSFKKIGLHGLRNYILGFGKYADIVFVLIYAVKPILFFVPASLMSILAGNIFGPIKGFILSMVGLFLSGTVAFFLAKLLGKPFVEKLLKGKTLKLDENIEEHGFKIMLLMRLSAIFPYDPLSYAAGLTKMRYIDFITATLIGTAPEFVAYSLMGKNMRHPFSIRFMFPIILIILVAVGGSYLYKSNKNKQDR